MTLEKAKEIIENEVSNICDKELSKAWDTVLKALENDKNAFIKQVEITKEANSLYEEEKEKNIKLEKEIRENYIPKETLIVERKKLMFDEDCTYCNNTCNKYSRCCLLNKLLGE